MSEKHTVWNVVKCKAKGSGADVTTPYGKLMDGNRLVYVWEPHSTSSCTWSGMGVYEYHRAFRPQIGDRFEVEGRLLEVAEIREARMPDVYCREVKKEYGMCHCYHCVREGSTTAAKCKTCSGSSNWECADCAKKEVWVCGQLRGKWSPKGSVWDFQGVFTTEARAVAACRNEQYFIFPTKLNKELPSRQVLHPRARYPKA